MATRIGLMVEAQVTQDGNTSRRYLVEDPSKTDAQARADFNALSDAQKLALSSTKPPVPSGGSAWSIVGGVSATGFLPMKPSDPGKLELEVVPGSVDLINGTYRVRNKITSPDLGAHPDKPWQYHTVGKFYAFSELPQIPYLIGVMQTVDMWQVNPSETDLNGRRAHSPTYNPPQQSFVYIA